MHATDLDTDDERAEAIIAAQKGEDAQTTALVRVATDAIEKLQSPSGATRKMPVRAGSAHGRGPLVY